MVIHGCWQNIQIIVLAQIYFLQEDLKMNIVLYGGYAAPNRLEETVRWHGSVYTL